MRPEASQGLTGFLQLLLLLQFEIEATNQRGLVGQLQGQIEELQAGAAQLSDENAKLKERVHEEVK